MKKQRAKVRFAREELFFLIPMRSGLLPFFIKEEGKASLAMLRRPCVRRL